MFGALKLSYDVLEITFQQDLKTFYQDFVQDIYCPKCETKCLFLSQGDGTQGPRRFCCIKQVKFPRFLDISP